MKQLSVIVLLLIPAFLSAQSVTGVWSTASSTGFMARSDFATAAMNGKIYVIGGKMGNSLISQINVYDPATDTWSTPTTTGTFTPRWSLGCAVVNGKIYTIGGTLNNLSMLTTLEVFDPATNTWTTPTTSGTFTARDAFATAVVNGLIYVMGGYTGGTDINSVQMFDPATNTWSTLSTTGSLITRDGLTANAIGNKIYAIAGITGDFSNILQVLDLSTNTWSTPTTTGWLTTRSNGASDVIDGKIYVVGGTNDTTQWVGGLDVFDPATNAWSTAVSTDSVIPRKELGAVALNGKLYVMGGLKKSGIASNYSNDVQYFTPAGSGVNQNPSLPTLTLSPNPTDGMVTIGGMPTGNYEISVANVLGKNVLPTNSGSGPTATLELSPLAPGAYFVTLRSANGTVTETIVKR